MLARYSYNDLAVPARVQGIAPTRPIDKVAAKGLPELFLDQLGRLILANRTILMFYRSRRGGSFVY